MSGPATARRTRRAVFLDRDGVLNQAVVRDGRPYPPASVEELHLLAGAEDACRRLAAAGWLLICVTNQPDIARGTQIRQRVDAINEALRRRLGLAAIRVCPHDDGDGCACRKPRPGLLLDAAVDFDIDLVSSIMVGDRWSDIEAGKRAGCRTVFIDHGYAEKRPGEMDFACAGLPEALPWILKMASS